MIKRQTPLAQVEALAQEKILPALAPYCERIEVAGSLRRRRPTCGDLDLVALPKDQEGLIARLTRNATCLERGRQNITVRLANGFEIGLYLAHHGDQDLFGAKTPGNFGTLLLCRTGSREHNIYIAETARRLGLHWNPYKGIIRNPTTIHIDGRGEDGKKFATWDTTGEIIAGETEESIFAALSINPVPPEQRER